MNVYEFVDSPVRLAAVRDAVLQIQRDVAPEEWEVTLDYVGPLIELAARDKLSVAEVSDAGGFGAEEWMLLPIVVMVMGVLQTRLEAGDTREITEGEVRGLVRRSGLLPPRQLVSELTRSLQKAFSQHLAGLLGRSPKGALEERHTDISCPRQVWKETPRFNLVVRLTLRPTPWSVAHRALDVETGQTILVSLQASAFDVLTAACQEVFLPPGQDSAPIVFDLRPRESGPQNLILDFFQASHPLGAVTVPVEVTEQPVPESQIQVAPSVFSLELEIPPPDRLLRISWAPERSSLAMSLIAGGSFPQDFPPWRLERDPALMAAHLFKDLDALTDGCDPTAQVIRGQQCSLSPQNINDELKVIGQNLWRTLPEGFRNLYSREREHWRDSSLLIYSDEPHLPWELVWPYGEGWEDEGPWGSTLCLSRWLRQDELGSGNTGPPGRLPLTALACIASTDLEAAQREKVFLHDLLEQRGVRDVSPPTPTREAVLGLLKSEPCDWMHVAAHGNFHADAPEEHSALWLEGQAILTPRHLVGPAIEDHLRQARPVFFFNACHAGRLGWSLTRIGGWAQRLVSCGAGMFLGPLWAVEDESAFRVTQSFYRFLLEGMTVAEAARQTRRAAREAGSLTWLAYSLYAHPNAKVRLVAPEKKAPEVPGA